MSHPRHGSRGNNKGQKKGGKGSWLMWGSAIAVLLSKSKGLLALLKFGKFGGTIITMVLSVGAYTLLFPWQMAVGLVLLIFVHELGHVFAAKQRGLPVSAPTFIPFLGALITMKRHPRDAETEAYLAIGGPILGTVGALAAFGIGLVLDSPVFYVIASFGIFINLINLLPIHPLDGGRIVTAISRWFWLLGLVGGLLVIVYLGSILFFIIWAMFAWDLWGKYGPKRSKSKQRAFEMTTEVPIEVFEASGQLIPGEEHRRRLPFTTYSDVASGKQYIEAAWPGVTNRLQTIELPSSAIVHDVEVQRVVRTPAGAPTHLSIGLVVKVEPYENDRYYDVPARTRWTYGIAYLSLAAFLIFMYAYVIPPYLPEIQ
jgi:Zn-dependent protease